MTNDIHKAVWTTRTPEDLDVLVAEAADRVRDDWGVREVADWKAARAIDNAEAQYLRLGVLFYKITNRLNRVAGFEVRRSL